MRVLSSYVDIIVYRGSDESKLYKLSEISTVPIINGLTDISHPCQIIADIMTLQEKFRSLNNLNLSWIGDGNNVCNSWIPCFQTLRFQFKNILPTWKFSCKKNFKKL